MQINSKNRTWLATILEYFYEFFGILKKKILKIFRMETGEETGERHRVHLLRQPALKEEESILNLFPFYFDST